MKEVAAPEAEAERETEEGERAAPGLEAAGAKRRKKKKRKAAAGPEGGTFVQSVSESSTETLSPLLLTSPTTRCLYK